MSFEDLFVEDIQNEIDKYIVDAKYAKRLTISFWLNYVYRQLEDSTTLNMNNGIIYIADAKIVQSVYKKLKNLNFKNVFINGSGNGLRFVVDPEFDYYWINKTIEKMLFKIENSCKSGNSSLRIDFGIVDELSIGLIKQRFLDLGYEVNDIYHGLSNDMYIEIKWD